MSYLSLDDFEWDEVDFDLWHLRHKTFAVTIAVIRNFNGWHVCVLLDDSQNAPLHVDTLDAAKALAQITANLYMEKYSEQYINYRRNLSRRVKTDGPPSVRAGVFKVG
jgi:ABC-type histidine transport system ATPase subunit